MRWSRRERKKIRSLSFCLEKKIEKKGIHALNRSSRVICKEKCLDILIPKNDDNINKKNFLHQAEMETVNKEIQVVELGRGF